MSFDRECMECGGRLVDRRPPVRQCDGCGARYQYAGGMLVPLGAEEPEPRRAARQGGGGQGMTFFGEDATGTWDDPQRTRRHGRRQLSLYENEVTYEDAFSSDPARACLGTARGLMQVGMQKEAAEYLLNSIEHELELELFYGEDHDASPYLELFDQALEAVGTRAREALQEGLRLRMARFERARDRDPPPEDRVQPFRAAVGRDLGSFLGNRASGFGDLPEERRLPLEGGTYHLVDGGEYRVGPPGGPDRRVRLDPFHIRERLVTVRDYANFLEATGYPPHPLWGWRGLDLSNQPVVGVSWEDAAAYASYHGGRLPTEAEWCASLDWDDPFIRLVPGTWEILLDDAGDPGGPMGTQGVVVLGTNMPKALRTHGGGRRQLGWGQRRVDAGFRVVLDPRMSS